MFCLCLVVFLDGVGNVVGDVFVEDEEVWFEVMCVVIVGGIVGDGVGFVDD